MKRLLRNVSACAPGCILQRYASLTGDEMPSETKDISQQADQFVRGYLTLESQPAEEASTDGQLATVLLSLNELFLASETGTIIDVGCGQGALLARLLDLPVFRERTGWTYVAVDEEESLNEVQTLARKARMSRRAEFIDLDSFYNEWPDMSARQVVFCRNVLHELSIEATIKLLGHIRDNVRIGDRLIIQDLLKLPISERGSACWMPDLLQDCLTELGFRNLNLIQQYTKKGNAWFSLVAEPSDVVLGENIDPRGAVLKARRSQWDLWSLIEAEGAKNAPGRGQLIEALDLDLQLAALTRQLRDVGSTDLVLIPDVEKRIRANQFNRRVSEFALSGNIIEPASFDEHVHFRERGEQLTVLETFLRSADRVAVVHGGVGTGKTTLVRRLLATRAYEKVPILVDGRVTRSFWGFVESLFSQIGLRLDPEALSVLSDLRASNFELAMRQFVNAYVGKIILFYDNFSDAQNPDGSVADPALGALLELLASKPGAKLVLAARSEYVPGTIQRANGGAPISARVGRYGSEQTVINVLDDSFNRSAAGLESYPQALLDAIDRHPLITSLAAQNLKRWGKEILLDARFVAELKGKMKEALWNRLVDEDSFPAMEIASQLRIPAPEALLTRFCSRESVAAAHRADLLWAAPDNRWTSLYSVLGLFRVRSLDSDDELATDASSPSVSVDHSAVSAAYREMYRLDDDPKWVRESYFHLMLSEGGAQAAIAGSLGNYYYDELVASADYEYMKNRDYKSALELYEIARGIRPLRQQSEMRRASCLIRERKRQVGEAAYSDLIAKYPQERGIKTSHVDALLYLGDYKEAKAALERYEFTTADGDWIAYEWGRVHLGLDAYEEAISALAPLVGGGSADSHYHEHYARALAWAGSTTEAEAVLFQAKDRFVDTVAIQTAWAIHLEVTGRLEEAGAALEPLFADRNDNFRAAASLIRVYRLLGRKSDAAGILRRIEKIAAANFYEYLAASRIEMMLADGKSDQAVELAASLMNASTYATFIGMRAIREVSDLAPEHEKATLRRTALSVRLPAALLKNAPIQLQRAQMAASGGNVRELAEIKTHLNVARLSKSEAAIFET